MKKAEEEEEERKTKESDRKKHSRAIATDEMTRLKYFFRI
jgi:hypothetical protein